MSYDQLLMLDDQARSFTAKAAEDISGGDLVGYFGTADSVGSDISTYAWDDFSVKKCSTIAGSVNVVGIALTKASSGATVAVASTGVFILPAGSSAVSGGFPIISCGYGNMIEAWLPAASGLNPAIGRAFTSATALTGFAIVKLDV